MSIYPLNSKNSSLTPRNSLSCLPSHLNHFRRHNVDDLARRHHLDQIVPLKTALVPTNMYRRCQLQQVSPENHR